MALALAAAVLGLAVMAAVTGAFGRPVPPMGVAMNLVYTAPTSVDAQVALPGAVQNTLRLLGAAHESIRLTRIDATGDASSKSIDLTPRVKEGDPHSDPLVDPSRVEASLTKKLTAILSEVNTVASTGGHALYQGLTKANLGDAPLIILSTGLDTASPDDFNSLRWAVRGSTLVEDIRRAGELAHLPARPVTFAVLPSSPAQPQLRAIHKTFLRGTWTDLLTASGATKVTFIDADPASAASTPVAGAPDSPAVDLTVLPRTPTPTPTSTPTPASTPTPTRTPTETQKQCTVAGALFVVDSPALIDASATVAQLRSCTAMALGVPGSTWELDGWTSADTDTLPVPDDPGRRTLSRQRVAVVADLITNRLGVTRGRIIRMTGHGNISQPTSPPSSSLNRLVRVTVTIPAH